MYMKEPVFSILMGGGRQNVVVSRSMAETVLSSPGISNSASVNRALEKVFGDRGLIRNLTPANRQLLDRNGVELLKRKQIADEACHRLKQLIQRETPNFVTFCRSVVDQVPWERGSQISVISDGDSATCETDFFTLVRSFVGHTMASVFMGQAILDDSPGFIQDLCSLDDRFMALMMGSTWLPITGLSAARLARDRLLDVLAVFQDAFCAWEDGVDPGVKFRDFDDVSEPFKQQARIFRKLGLSARASAPGHLSLLWTLIADISNITFWNILRIFADGALLDDIRKEIAPYTKASRPSREETGFPFQEPPTLRIDLEGLCNSCPLLKASCYETMRLDSAPLSFTELTSDLTVEESTQESIRPRTYRLRKSENVAVPHGIFHNDSQSFSNPCQYDPLRFIRTDPETETRTAYMHTIRPLGSMLGSECSYLLEKGMLAFTAAIVMVWEVEPVGDNGTIPKHKPSMGAFLPRNDVRMRLRARV